MAKICCECSQYNKNSVEKCSFCGCEHLNFGHYIGETVYIDGKVKGNIIGTSTIVRNGQVYQLWVVETEVYYSVDNGGSTNLIIAHGDNLKDEYIGE